MTGNGIGDEEAKSMGEMLKVNTTLKELYLEREKERKEKRERKRMNDREWDWSRGSKINE